MNLAGRNYFKITIKKKKRDKLKDNDSKKIENSLLSEEENVSRSGKV